MIKLVIILLLISSSLNGQVRKLVLTGTPTTNQSQSTIPSDPFHDYIDDVITTGGVNGGFWVLANIYNEDSAKVDRVGNNDITAINGGCDWIQSLGFACDNGVAMNTNFNPTADGASINNFSIGFTVGEVPVTPTGNMDIFGARTTESQKVFFRHTQLNSEVDFAVFGENMLPTHEDLLQLEVRPGFSYAIGRNHSDSMTIWVNGVIDTVLYLVDDAMPNHDVYIGGLNNIGTLINSWIDGSIIDLYWGDYDIDHLYAHNRTVSYFGDIFIPNPVSDLNSATTGSTSIQITWSAVVGGIFYDLYHSTNGTDFSVLQADIDIDDLPYDHTGLTASTQHWYKVKAKSAVGTEGNFSNTDNSTTNSGDITAPQLLSAVTTNATTIKLTFDEAVVNVSTGDFNFDGSVSGNDISATSVSGSGTVWNYHFASSWQIGETIDADGGGDIEDLAGNAFAGVTNFAVSNTLQGVNVLAFDGARGQGAPTTGARHRPSKELWIIDDCNDWENFWEDNDGVADVGYIIKSGRYDCNRTMTSGSDYKTLLGQGAPYPGPILTGTIVNLNKDQLIWRGVAHIGGNGLQADGDIMAILSGAQYVMVDHCMQSWGKDGAADVNSSSNEVLYWTYQNCLVAENLNGHNLLSVVDSHTGSTSHESRGTFYQMNWAQAGGRMPTVNFGLPYVEVINCRMYNWGDRATLLNHSDGNSNSPLFMNWVGNYAIPGPSIIQNDAIDFNVSTPTKPWSVLVYGNRGTDRTNNGQAQNLVIPSNHRSHSEWIFDPSTPAFVGTFDYTTVPSGWDIADTVLYYSGPFYMNQEAQRLINEIIDLDARAVYNTFPSLPPSVSFTIDPEAEFTAWANLNGFSDQNNLFNNFGDVEVFNNHEAMLIEHLANSKIPNYNQQHIAGIDFFYTDDWSDGGGNGKLQDPWTSAQFITQMSGAPTAGQYGFKTGEVYSSITNTTIDPSDTASVYITLYGDLSEDWPAFGNVGTWDSAANPPRFRFDEIEVQSASVAGTSTVRVVFDDVLTVDTDDFSFSGSLSGTKTITGVSGHSYIKEFAFGSSWNSGETITMTWKGTPYSVFNYQTSLSSSNDTIDITTEWSTTDWESEMDAGDNSQHMGIWAVNDSLYWVWVDDGLRPKVGKKPFGGSVTTDFLDKDSPEYNVLSDNHNRFSIAVDPFGYIHITGDMHHYRFGTAPGDSATWDWMPTRYQNHVIMYWVSDQPYDISGFTYYGTSSDSRRIDGYAFTYGRFFKNPVTGTIFYRSRNRVYDGGHDDGELGVSMWRYEADTQTWTKLGAIPSHPSQTATEYAIIWGDGSQDNGSPPFFYQGFENDAYIDHAGRMYAATAVAIGTGLADPNYVIFAYSDDEGDTWKTAAGGSITMPATESTGDVVVNHAVSDFVSVLGLPDSRPMVVYNDVTSGNDPSFAVFTTSGTWSTGQTDQLGGSTKNDYIIDNKGVYTGSRHNTNQVIRFKSRGDTGYIINLDDEACCISDQAARETGDILLWTVSGSTLKLVRLRFNNGLPKIY